MAATAATNGQVNGTAPPERFIDKETFDPDDLERQRELMKSVEVREDMRAMEARKRVSEILNSQAFKEELEDIIETQDLAPSDVAGLKSGPHPASLIALQQISQLVLPGSSNAASKIAGASVSGPVIPIADIRGINASVYSKGERLLRCKLAAVYRLLDMKGWSTGIHDQVTARLSQDKEHFLTSAHGLLYNEITAGSLVKIDMQGNVVDRGNTSLSINAAGWQLHAAIHAARPDIRCILHTRVPATVGVSCMKQGLLPLCQEAMQLGPVSFHTLSSATLSDSQKEALARDLGPNNKVLLLRNHGVLACGSTIEEAFHLTQLAIAACENQMRLAQVGVDNLLLPSEEMQQAALQADVTPMVSGADARKWRRGELQFEAQMRVLDNAGYRTGYVYKIPVLKCDRTDRQTSEVEYPPATSLLAYYDETGALKPQIREVQERNRRAHKTDWLNTPNVYKKEEIEEIGTDNPKKITKWVASSDSPSKQGAPVMVDNKNQFAPLGSNPKEFVQQQRQIKDGYYQDKISAGYQSKILEGGLTEGQLLDANQSSAGDHVVVVGSASKGIIKREHQHNAIVYKSYYATNPFDSMTAEELRDYEEAVKRGEKPSKEEVLADLEQQQTLQAESAPPADSTDAAADEIPPEMVESTATVDSEAGERPSSPDAPVNGEDSQESPNKEGKEKKKKGRMPSFSFGKKKDKKKTTTAV